MQRNFLLIAAFLLFTGLLLSSCNRGTGCPMNEQAHPDMEKKKKKSQSNLFPKDMRRQK